jgi:hypothetical protein
MTATAEAIEALHEAMCGAMLAGNLAELDSILGSGFTLTHMTGYVQSRAEWLEAIESGGMHYHRMETVEAVPWVTRALKAGSDPATTTQSRQEEATLRQAVLERKREVLLELRLAGTVDDIVARANPDQARCRRTRPHRRRKLRLTVFQTTDHYESRPKEGTS